MRLRTFNIARSMRATVGHAEFDRAKSATIPSRLDCDLDNRAVRAPGSRNASFIVPPRAS
jgi:hypothetical protein